MCVYKILRIFGYFPISLLINCGYAQSEKNEIPGYNQNFRKKINEKGVLSNSISLPDPFSTLFHLMPCSRTLTCWNISSDLLCSSSWGGPGNFGGRDENMVKALTLIPFLEVTSVWLSPLKRWHYCTQNGLFYTIPFGSENLSYSTSPLYVGRVTFASVTKVLGFCTNLCVFPRLQPFFF